MPKPVMTLAAVCADLREYGFKLAPQKLAKGIESGLYPFGKVLQVGETGKRTFQILRKDYEEWKSKYITYPHTAQTLPEPVSSLSSNWDLVSTHTYTQEGKDMMWEVIIRCWSPKKT